MTKQAGALMRSEINEAPDRFIAMLGRDLSIDVSRPNAIYTIARGSSDAAANILSYEYMRELEIPVTTLPPSVFSLGGGVDLTGAMGLVISQSGASSDLVKACAGVKARGGTTVVLTNTAGSPASKIADISIDMQAGPELAIPATKSVIGTIAAGMVLLTKLKPEYIATCQTAAKAMAVAKGKQLPNQKALEDALVASDSVYVIGRGCGFGAAHEIALKFKECAALHAEAYSSSEVLHGPLQLATKPLMVLILDTGEANIQESLNIAEARFKAINAPVFRVRPSDLGVSDVSPATAAAVLLYALYPVVHNVTIAQGMDPDAPETLAKITDTV
ncbi:MAG: SIS domain-containing protein [Rhodobacteraceae bacterium]|nr:SIS domain-containing protein [Paracoccaceae bacterium]